MQLIVSASPCLTLLKLHLLFHRFSYSCPSLLLFPFKSFSTYPTHSPLTFLHKRNNRKRDPPFPCPDCVWKVVQLYGGGKEGDWGPPSFTRGYKGPWQKWGGNSPHRVFPNNTDCCLVATFFCCFSVPSTLSYPKKPPHGVITQTPKCPFLSFSPGSNSVCIFFFCFALTDKATRQVEFV